MIDISLSECSRIDRQDNRIEQYADMNMNIIADRNGTNYGLD